MTTLNQREVQDVLFRLYAEAQANDSKVQAEEQVLPAAFPGSVRKTPADTTGMSKSPAHRRGQDEGGCFSNLTISYALLRLRDRAREFDFHVAGENIRAFKISSKSGRALGTVFRKRSQRRRVPYYQFESSRVFEAR